MSYRFLDSVKPSRLLSVFNEAFSDYVLPMPPIHEDVFQWKLQRDGVSLSLSPGYFDQRGRLKGLMLHAVGPWQEKKTVYNAGTGIVPSARRQGAASGMLAHCRPYFEKEGIAYLLLECITRNQPALALYEKAGYEKLRELICFQGKAPECSPPFKDLLFQPITEQIPWADFQRWWSFPPSWQNDIPAIERVRHTFRVYGLQRNEQLLAYAVIKPDNGYLAQFAVAPEVRGQGLGSYLLHRVQTRTPRILTLVNLDLRDTALMRFMERLQLKETVRQFEMGKNL